MNSFESKESLRSRENLSKNELDMKSLIGMTRLSFSQLNKYFTHPNYKLKGSYIVIKNNDLSFSNTLYSGVFAHVNEMEMEIVIDGKGLKNGIFLDQEMVLIIFRDGIPKYAVFHD